MLQWTDFTDVGQIWAFTLTELFRGRPHSINIACCLLPAMGYELHGSQTDRSTQPMNTKRRKDFVPMTSWYWNILDVALFYAKLVRDGQGLCFPACLSGCVTQQYIWRHALAFYKQRCCYSFHKQSCVKNDPGEQCHMSCLVVNGNAARSFVLWWFSWNVSAKTCITVRCPLPLHRQILPRPPTMPSAFVQRTGTPFDVHSAASTVGIGGTVELNSTRQQLACRWAF